MEIYAIRYQITFKVIANYVNKYLIIAFKVALSKSVFQTLMCTAIEKILKNYFYLATQAVTTWQDNLEVTFDHY